jgi:hypothetical protein
VAYLFQSKPFAPDRLYATGVEIFSRSAPDKLGGEAEDAVYIFEAAKRMRAMWNDDVKTILQTLCGRVAV